MDNLEKARHLINSADSLIIFAGAGIGADSGLPVFRSTDGLWEHYPFLKKLNLNFKSIANPDSFLQNPSEANQFYQHRMEMYKITTPHNGFKDLLRFAVESVNENYFVVTSNVDGHFEKAGFEINKIYEVHGNINRWQCSSYKCSRINKGLKFEDFMIKDDIAHCNECGAYARPNILMFYDFDWEDSIYCYQRKLYSSFLFNEKFKNTVVVEIGAGSDISTIRNLSLEAANSKGSKPIRINIDNEVDSRYINIIKTSIDGINDLFK